MGRGPSALEAVLDLLPVFEADDPQEFVLRHCVILRLRDIVAQVGQRALDCARNPEDHTSTGRLEPVMMSAPSPPSSEGRHSIGSVTVTSQAWRRWSIVVYACISTHRPPSRLAARTGRQ